MSAVPPSRSRREALLAAPVSARRRALGTALRGPARRRTRAERAAAPAPAVGADLVRRVAAPGGGTAESPAPTVPGARPDARAVPARSPDPLPEVPR